MVEDDHLARRAVLWSVLCVCDLRVRQRQGLDPRPGDFLFGDDVCRCVHYPGRRSCGSACDASPVDGVAVESALVANADPSHVETTQGASVCRRGCGILNSSVRCRANDQWLSMQTLHVATAVGRLSRSEEHTSELQ